eukprot:1161308-Pelagomonas_calceolata.AAC.11
MGMNIGRKAIRVERMRLAKLVQNGNWAVCPAKFGSLRIGCPWASSRLGAVMATDFDVSACPCYLTPAASF